MIGIAGNRLGTQALAFWTLALVGCGGGGESQTAPPPPPPAETIFVAANAWVGPVPAGADMIDAEDLRRRVASGELSIITPDAPLAQRAARRQKFDLDRAYLESLPNRSDTLNALLAEAAAAGGLGDENEAILPNGNKVVLLDLGTRFAQAADAYRQSHDVTAARAAYALSYDLLRADVRGQALPPSSLAAASLEEIDAASRQLDVALATEINLDNVRIEPAATSAPAMQKQGPGSGRDSDVACTAPTGILAHYWFPLKKFISPVKQQGHRGTCWAFAAVGSIESRELVQDFNAVDLSEQFVIYKVKYEWNRIDFIDGSSVDDALKNFVDRGQQLMTETGWTYNPAPNRPENALDKDVVGTLASYTNACQGYTGWCSPTAHEAPGDCATSGAVTVCSLGSVATSGPTTAASRAQHLWSSGDTFHLEQYRALLAAGYSLIASFPVYDGFKAAPRGVVSDYSRQYKIENGRVVDGSEGGHAAQIVGFIGNSDLSHAGVQINVGGGGYFVMRNSWGCAVGDGGYYYVPADYVSSIFSTLSVLDFDSRRSSRWTTEQAVPGGNDPLSIGGMNAIAADLRVKTNLAGNLSISHSSANYVHLIVRSNVDGLLYDGQWLVNPPPGGGLFANSLPVTFSTPGERTLTFTATYGTQTASALKTVLVLNSPPEVALDYGGIPQQGEPFFIRAVVTDYNEPDLASLCAATVWQLTAPDTIVSGEGCIRTIRFGAQGARSITVGARDSEGLTDSKTVVFEVAPPPENPYPRIIGSGVFARNPVFVGGALFGCAYPAVATGATINLRDLGCVLAGDPPTRYFGQITVENPASEVLSYDWTYSVFSSEVAATPDLQSMGHTDVPTYEFAAQRFPLGGDAPLRCILAVRVNAPEAARTKTLTIWTGRCMNYPAEIN